MKQKYHIVAAPFALFLILSAVAGEDPLVKPATHSPTNLGRGLVIDQLPPFDDIAQMEPDNLAAHYARARQHQAATGPEQGLSNRDKALTARIHKEITADDTLSNVSRSVLISTSNGRVTLRGPVSSAREKSIIGAIAGRIALHENVDNQLRVELGTTSNY